LLDQERYIPYLLHQAHLAVFRTFEHRLVPSGLTLPQWRVLAALAHHKQLRVGELARIAGQEPPTLVRQLGVLEQRKLTRRIASEADKRATYVELTDAGSALTDELLPQALEIERRALVGFSEDEIEFLRRLLCRVRANAEG
jgi:DNA-binding MarR family transcriptional regulator